MQHGIDPPETPELFLLNLSEELNDLQGIDGDLLSILREHILTATPVKDAVTLAKAAIVNLAGDRAAPPKAEAANG